MNEHNSTSITDARLIMYHKQSTSARTSFLRLGNGGVCAFEPFPTLAQVLGDGESNIDTPSVINHPAPLIAKVEQQLGMAANSLVAEREFLEQVDIPGKIVTVYLARFTTMDPPHQIVATTGCRFGLLTEFRDLPPVELELLRRAYKVIMGG